MTLENLIEDLKALEETYEDSLVDEYMDDWEAGYDCSTENHLIDIRTLIRKYTGG